MHRSPRHRTRRPRAAVASPAIETLEPRRLMSDVWGGAPRLTRLDQAVERFPEIDGTGQTVAVIDTGIDYTHPLLGGGFGEGRKVVGGYDFVDDDADPIDTDGHGTAVAGVIAADAFESGGFTYRGVAPAARLVALRIAPDTDQVPLDRIERALQWVIDNHQALRITTVNLSFGYGRFASNYTDSTLSDELGEIGQLGIAFVSSAGNAGIDDGPGITFPAADAIAISVGSVGTSDLLSEFGQRSRNLDILAVGENVRSTGLGGTFVNVAGTSFAAPAVAGTLALVRQVDPTFTLGDVRSILRASSASNRDGDDESGATTGLTFQRLDVLATVGLAVQRRAAAPEQAAAVGARGSANDLAFDRDGVLHFVWYDGGARTMRYATRGLNGFWSAPAPVDDDRQEVGTELSLALDSRGRPNLAYLDNPGGDLKFARNDGLGWDVETLDSAKVTGLYPSLAIDSDDRRYVSYYRRTSTELKLATFDDGRWSRRTVDDDGDVGHNTEIAIDHAGRIAIAYGDPGRDQLRLARQRDDGTFDIEVADARVDGANHLSLAFDSGDRPGISYYETSSADLKYAGRPSRKGWKVVRIATRGATGLYTNLEIDVDRRASILFWDRRTGALELATGDGTRFSTSRVRAGLGKYTSATRSTIDGRWTYASADARDDGRLAIGTVPGQS